MLKKTLYSLEQASRQWYERLSNFLPSHSYKRGKIDKTLLIKKANSDIILVEVYLDDIIFRRTNEKLCKEFVVDIRGNLRSL